MTIVSDIPISTTGVLKTQAEVIHERYMKRILVMMMMIIIEDESKE